MIATEWRSVEELILKIFKTFYQSKMKNMMCTLLLTLRADEDEWKGIKYSCHVE